MGAKFEFLLFSVVMGSENGFWLRDMSFSLWVSLSTLFFVVFSFLNQFVLRCFNGGTGGSLKSSCSVSRENNFTIFSRENISDHLPPENSPNSLSAQDDSTTLAGENNSGSVSRENKFTTVSRESNSNYVSRENHSGNFNSLSIENSSNSLSRENHFGSFSQDNKFSSFSLENSSKSLCRENNSSPLSRENSFGSLSRENSFGSHSGENNSVCISGENNSGCISGENNSGCISGENNHIDDDSEVETLPEQSDSKTQTSEIIDSDEQANEEFVFKFKFQTYEEFSKTNKEHSNSDILNSNPSSSLNNRYEFIPAKSSSYFIEETEIPNFTVEVINPHPNDNFPGNEGFSEKISKSEPTDEDDFLTEKDFNSTDSDSSTYEFSIDGFLSESDFEEKTLKESFPWDSEEPNGLETQWEHQELMEQLKIEVRKVRATGLPTILEESESPKIMADLKPWKIDEKYQRGDLMDELHKFYRSYRERMRKLDIFNYQKMYAIGFLQSKDPLKSFSSISKPSSPSITSLLSQNLRFTRQKKSQVDPMENFIRELHCDLEMVYVGQMCLSWEFIQWQYEKALDLWESDPYGLHLYNEVAGEFQQFQVLLQRFVENEAFEGPRIENYVKKRCVARNLLQVPVIREDKQKNRGIARILRDKDEAITSDMLIEILQESIRVIWQFIRADKDRNVAPKKFQIEFQDPIDKQLFVEIQSDLQKKEKKLKEIVRSGNCILKKLKRDEEDETEGGDVYFFCEVDVKLVSRVLRMSKITTDQLVWCRNKLERIKFQNRKLHLEPSFFLFPC